ncbi:MAG: YbfB/YjiJ family MFS transporter, partial [Vulcanimicrobiaceae bacterium]
VTGIASGFVFVLGSSILLDRAARECRPDWIAMFYGGGVGAGIVLTALAVPALTAWDGWRAGWLGLALISAVLCAVMLPSLTDTANAEVVQTKQDPKRPDARLFGWLFVSYGLQGMGYIIPATFLVAMVAGTPAIAQYAVLTWIVVGVVAIPSTIIWNRVGIAIGRDIALVIALAVMAIGAIAPAVATNAFGVIVAAATLGTFLGVAALSTALARAIRPEESHVAIGQLTASFGVGQIFGPAVAGLLISDYESYTPALVVAAGVLSLSATVMACGAILARVRTRTA